MDEYINGQLCPVCGKFRFLEDDNFEICKVCGWEDDGLQRDDPDLAGGANVISLNQAREVWKQTESAAAMGIADRRAYKGMPVFDENGKVILEEPTE